MPKFSVPVTIEINGSIEVEADSQDEAIDAAKDEYDRRFAIIKPLGTFGKLGAAVMDGPDVQVIFAHGDDPDEVEEAEG